MIVELIPSKPAAINNKNSQTIKSFLGLKQTKPCSIRKEKT